MERLEYEREVMNMAGSLGEVQRQKFITVLQSETKNPVALYGWNIWLGWLGIDRFIVGDIVLGILKLITGGGFGIWVLVDCFLIGNRTREKNIEKARYIYDSLQRREALKDSFT